MPLSVSPLRTMYFVGSDVVRICPGWMTSGLLIPLRAASRLGDMPARDAIPPRVSPSRTVYESAVATAGHQSGATAMAAVSVATAARARACILGVLPYLPLFALDHFNH